MAGYYDSRIESTDEIDISGARWVFIIEKEVCLASLQLNATGWVLADLVFQPKAVFHRLVRSSYPTRAIMGNGILITVSKDDCLRSV